MKPGRSINVLICPWRTFVSRAVLGFIAATAWAEPAEIPKEKTTPLAAWLSADGITGDWGDSVANWPAAESCSSAVKKWNYGVTLQAA